MAHFQTTDMAQAAFLCSEGHWYQSIKRVHERTKKCIWSFEDCDEITALAALYRTGTALVNPLAYTKALSDVRGAMYEFLQGDHAPHA